VSDGTDQPGKRPEDPTDSGSEPTLRRDADAEATLLRDGGPEPAPEEQRLGPYVLGQQLGRGGMGQVYRAFDPRLGRNVALKVLTQEVANDPAFRERFLRESRILASLDHPNIVPIYDAGEADGRLYIAMRYVEGSDLRDIVRREGQLSVERVVEILGPVAGALDAAHSRGVIHRDVKPENILLSASGDVYLSDFGIAKQSAGPAGATMTGVFLGTPGYVAPEQIEGSPVTAATDVYALACLVHSCLAGEPPFVRATEAAVLVAHLRDEPPRLSAVRPDLPAALDGVLARALAKPPAQRFATCTDFLQALQAAARTPAKTVDIAPSPPRPAPRPVHRPSRQPGRNVPALVAGIAAVALVALAAAFALSGGVAGPTATPRPPSGQPPVISGGGLLVFDARTDCGARACFIDVLDGVDDPDGDPVTLDSVGPSTAGNGVVLATFEGRPVARWTAAEGFAGSSDTFPFTVSDDNGNVVQGTCQVQNIPPP
jgi:serine/threonine protein kinase